jgi:hypothetical protein
MGNEVNAYIEKQKSPQKEILQEVRKVFRDTLPNWKEELWWGRWDLNPGSPTPQAGILNHARRRPRNTGL